MRAAIYAGRGQRPKVAECPDPVPGPRDVVIRVDRCGVCGSDVRLHAVVGPDSETGLVASLRPGTDLFGHEYCGVVVAVGHEVTRFGAGARVTSMAMAGCESCRQCAAGEVAFCANRRSCRGGFAELVRSSEFACLPLPDHVSAAGGALVEPVAVAVNALDCAGSVAGRSVLVLGAGLIGLVVARLASRAGAARIVVVSRSARRVAQARRVGADRLLGSGPDLPARVASELDGLADVVLDCAGGTDTLATAIDCVRARGSVAVVGATYSPTALVPARALVKAVTVRFCLAYSKGQFARGLDIVADDDGVLSSLVTVTVGFDDFPAVFDAGGAAAAECKVQLDPWQR
jgi:threonine dehydrogenase-like Zn-dependent dehydrogenase